MKELTITVSGKAGNCKLNVLAELYTFLDTLGATVHTSPETLREIVQLTHLRQYIKCDYTWRPNDLSIKLIGMQEPRVDGHESGVEIGDVVSLLSGGPAMTVSNFTSDGKVQCIYFNDKQELQELELNPDLLMFDDVI